MLPSSAEERMGWRTEVNEIEYINPISSSIEAHTSNPVHSTSFSKIMTESIHVAWRILLSPSSWPKTLLSALLRSKVYSFFAMNESLLFNTNKTARSSAHGRNPFSLLHHGRNPFSLLHHDWKPRTSTIINETHLLTSTKPKSRHRI